MRPKFCEALVTRYDLFSQRNLEPLSYLFLFGYTAFIHHSPCYYVVTTSKIGLYWSEWPGAMKINLRGAADLLQWNCAIASHCTVDDSAKKNGQLTLELFTVILCGPILFVVS